MLKNFAAIVLVMLVQVGELEAQVLLPPVVYGPPLVYGPPVIHGPPLIHGPRRIFGAPTLFGPPVVYSAVSPDLIINDEIWKTTVLTDVYYTLNGVQFYVTETGEHFSLGKNVSTIVGNRFMEPYSQYTGLRIPKPISSPFVSGTPSYQDGPKTVFISHGEEHFATWVYSGANKPIEQIWVRKGKSSSLGIIEGAPTPTPIEKWEPVLPSHEKKHFMNGDGDGLLPTLPPLPAPTSPKELKETTSSPVVASEEVIRN